MHEPLLIQRLGYASKTLFEWFIITETDHMFNGTGTSELIRFERKGIVIGEQKLLGDDSIAWSPLT